MDRAGCVTVQADARFKVVLFANTDWYLYNFRIGLAREIRNAGGEVVFVSPPGRYGEELRKQGFRWVAVPMVRRSLSPLRELRLLWSLGRVYRSEAPDLAHHFTVKCVIYGAIAARMAQTPAVVGAVTGLGYVFSSNRPLAAALRPFVKRLLRFAVGGPSTRLIVQNPQDAQSLQRAGVCAAEQLRLIYGSGVNTSRFAPAEPVVRSKPRVLFIARLLKQKGIAEFIDAARLILNSHAGIADFWVAGESDPGNPDAISIKQLAAWKQVAGVTFLGHVDDVPSLMRDVDIVVLPSYYPEGVPRSLIEAAASGLPVITTDMPGCREIVVHKKTGLIVPPRDASALAGAIGQLLADPDLRTLMGRAGRNLAVTRFGEETVLAKTMKVYRELLPNLLPP